MQQFNSERFGGPDTPEDELRKRADFGFEAEQNSETEGGYAGREQEGTVSAEAGEQPKVEVTGSETGTETPATSQLSPESILNSQTEPESEADKFIADHVGGDREVTEDTAADVLNDLLNITQKSETK